MGAMKSYLILVTGAVLALAACTQTLPYGAMNGTLPPKENPAHRQYLALPGQGAVNTHATDTDAAFEEQVAAYTGQTVQPTQPELTPQLPAYPVQPVVNNNPIVNPTYTQPVVSPTYPQPTLPQTVINQPAADGTAGYAVQVNNATNGRIFVEMHDDSDNIFPVASMYAGQRISTQPAEPRPIQGGLTVVIRDPDQPGAPELRRYRVSTPPTSYMGKTINITLLQGGRYRAALDGEVYYATPEPTEKPAEKKAEEPAKAQPAPAPAATPAA